MKEAQCPRCGKTSPIDYYSQCFPKEKKWEILEVKATYDIIKCPICQYVACIKAQ